MCRYDATGEGLSGSVMRATVTRPMCKSKPLSDDLFLNDFGMRLCFAILGLKKKKYEITKEIFKPLTRRRILGHNIIYNMLSRQYKRLHAQSMVRVYFIVNFSERFNTRSLDFPTF